jgi:hypothetical protein
MCTSLVLFALSGMFTPAITEAPRWSDYPEGMRLSERERKPIAVFIGSGKKGWERVSQEGKFSPRIHEQLAADYICVYVDAREHETLAAAFEIDGTGLVISSAGGKLQAFRHEGELANEDLERYLASYSDPEREVRQTVDTRRARSYYQQPVEYAAPVCRT